MPLSLSAGIVLLRSNNLLKSIPSSRVVNSDQVVLPISFNSKVVPNIRGEWNVQQLPWNGWGGGRAVETEGLGVGEWPGFTEWSSGLELPDVGAVVLGLDEDWLVFVGVV